MLALRASKRRRDHDVSMPDESTAFPAFPVHALLLCPATGIDLATVAECICIGLGTRIAAFSNPR